MARRIRRVAYAFPWLITIVVGVGCGGSSNGGGTNFSVSLSPKRAAVVTITQTAQFTATVTGDTQNRVTWSVDGTDGGSVAVGSISAAGLYTPPPTAGTHSIRATSVSDTTKSASATIA